jgi:alginate O-acetyltransferase complex protein AlgI
MVFADLFFIYVFLPLCLICYGLAKKLSTKNIVLIVFSLIFYAWGEPLWILLFQFIL